MPSKLTRESLYVRGYGYIHGRGRVIPPHAMDAVRVATKPFGHFRYFLRIVQTDWRYPKGSK